MTKKKLTQQRQLLIDTLIAVYPLIGRGFVTVGTGTASGQTHIKNALAEAGVMEKEEAK